MKTKLEMAHEFMMKKMETETIDNHWELFYTSWRYADAMQAEADKREQKKQSEHVFEAVDEWQPDWSQAPDSLVKYFAVDKNGRGGWFISKPTLCSDHWYWSDFEERVDNDNYDHAPSFGYTGDWRNSLRKRPE